MEKTDNLIWIDLEMSGLDPFNHKILQIAIIATDKELNHLSDVESIFVHQPEDVFLEMDDWNKKYHYKNGVYEKCSKSPVNVVEAEKICIDYIMKYTDGKAPLCGNSVWQDKRFLYIHMPRVAACLHYRIIDVSTLKILNSLWYEDTLEFQKQGVMHLANEDILASIRELQYYRKTILK